MWDYYDFSNFYGVSLEEYALSDKSGAMADRQLHAHIGRNQMMWDLGLNPDSFENQTAVVNTIKEIDKMFDLVMMTERFDESIVLLKRLLCWDYQDLSSLKLNSCMEFNFKLLKS